MNYNGFKNNKNRKDSFDVFLNKDFLQLRDAFPTYFTNFIRIINYKIPRKYGVFAVE